MAADISGDGSLDVKEFLSFSHPEEDPAMRPHVLAQVHSTPHLSSLTGVSKISYFRSVGPIMNRTTKYKAYIHGTKCIYQDVLH